MLNTFYRVAQLLSNPQADRISLSFDGLPPGPNQKGKRGWRINAVENKRWREEAMYTARAANARVASGLAVLHYHVSLGDHRRHDHTNIAAAMKHVEDGLVDAGVIRDDTIDDVLPIFTFDREKPRRFTLDIYSLD